MAKKNFKNTDKIMVKALVNNVHYTCPKTFEYFHWENARDEHEMTFEQVKLMKVKHKNYFTNKWLFIEDEAVLDALGISDIFAVKFNMRADMKLLYGNDVDAVKKKLCYITKKKELEVIEKVKIAVKQGKIIDIRIIKLLERTFNIDLMELTKTKDAQN